MSSEFAEKLEHLIEASALSTYGEVCDFAHALENLVTEHGPADEESDPGLECYLAISARALVALATHGKVCTTCIEMRQAQEGELHAK